MAHIQKTVTYNMPDEYEGTTNTQGKTSTMPYDGPEQLILWVDKESGEIEQTWDDQPVQNLEPVLQLMAISLL